MKNWLAYSSLWVIPLGLILATPVLAQNTINRPTNSNNDSIPNPNDVRNFTPNANYFQRQGEPNYHDGRYDYGPGYNANWNEPGYANRPALNSDWWYENNRNAANYYHDNLPYPRNNLRTNRGVYRPNVGALRSPVYPNNNYYSARWWDW